MKISYADLARRVGDSVLNNSLHSRLGADYTFELVNGCDSYCIKHEDLKECENNKEDCDYELHDIYQEYIISYFGAEYLKEHTSEIVYYCEELDLYLWGITHFGTPWSGVFTEIKE